MLQITFLGTVSGIPTKDRNHSAIIFEHYTDKIKDSLSKILDIEKGNIGLTYTSGENLTSFGKGEGMQCSCVVTVKNQQE